MIKSPSWIDSLKHLTYKYISNQNTRGSVFRRDRDTSQWNQVNKGSRHWKEAHGWSYFHSPMNLTSRVGMALLRHSGNYAWRRKRQYGEPLKLKERKKNLCAIVICCNKVLKKKRKHNLYGCSLSHITRIVGFWHRPMFYNDL